jgi:BatD DUF11 like domain
MFARALPGFVWLAALSWLLASNLAQAQVRVQMQASAKEIALGEHVVVQITVQTQGGSPEIELPEFDGFDVVQRSVQKPMSFSFGFGQGAPQVTSSTHYTFVLRPLAGGQYKLAPVRVTLEGKQYTSQELTLTVRDAGGQGQQPAAQPQQQQQPSAAGTQAPVQPATGGDAYQVDGDAFLRTVVDKTDPFLGEQVTATVFLYTRRSLQQAPAIRAEPSTDGFWIHDVLAGQTPEPSRVMIGGRAYWVYVLRRFAAFPLRAGELTIGAMTLTISRESIFDMLDPNGAQPNLDRTGVPLLVRVKPLPDAGRPPTDPANIAVGKLELSAQLDRAQVATGDAVTLTATVRGEGNVAAIRMPTPSVQGLEVLQPETRELIEVQQDVVTGSRTFSWLIVAREPGSYALPPLTLETFDAKAGAYRRLESAPLTLTAVGNPQPTAAAALAHEPPPNAAQPQPDEVRPEGLPPLHTQSALARTQVPLADRAWFPFMLLLGPCLWLASISVPAVRRRLSQRPGSALRERVRAASARLRAAERALLENDGAKLHSELAAALVGVVSAKLDENLTGLTRQQARERLASRGLPEGTLLELLELLERCDAARFSPAASAVDEMQRMLERARACFATIEAAS